MDESNDRSLIMIQRWVAQNLYATEFKKHRSPQVEGDLNGNWTSDRINYVASLKEDALVRAREISADYVWVRLANKINYDTDPYRKVLVN